MIKISRFAYSLLIISFVFVSGFFLSYRVVMSAPLPSCAIGVPVNITQCSCTMPYHIKKDTNGYIYCVGSVSCSVNQSYQDGSCQCNPFYHITPSGCVKDTPTNCPAGYRYVPDPGYWTTMVGCVKDSVPITPVAASCTGTLPTGVSLCDGDNTGLTTSVPWAVVSSCTAARKCEVVAGVIPVPRPVLSPQDDCRAAGADYYWNTSTNSCKFYSKASSCTGAKDPNSVICSNNTAPTQKTLQSLVVACTLTRPCEYVCEPGYEKSGEKCVPAKSGFVIKHVGPDLKTTSVPVGVHATAWGGAYQSIDARTNPYSKNLTLLGFNGTVWKFRTEGYDKNYAVTVATCSYPLGGTECSVTEADFKAPDWVETSTATRNSGKNVTLSAGVVTRVVFRYVPSERVVLIAQKVGKWEDEERIPTDSKISIDESDVKKFISKNIYRIETQEGEHVFYTNQVSDYFIQVGTCKNKSGDDNCMPEEFVSATCDDQVCRHKVTASKGENIKVVWKYKPQQRQLRVSYGTFDENYKLFNIAERTELNLVTNRKNGEGYLISTKTGNPASFELKHDSSSYEGYGVMMYFDKNILQKYTLSVAGCGYGYDSQKPCEPIDGFGRFVKTIPIACDKTMCSFVIDGSFTRNVAVNILVEEKTDDAMAVIVSFADKQNTESKESVYNKIVNEVNDYYRKASFGKWVDIEGDVIDDITLEIPEPEFEQGNVTDFNKKTKELLFMVEEKLKQKRAYLQAKKVVFLVFPPLKTSFAGTAGITSSHSNSFIQIYGNEDYRTYAHELGHVLGIGHVGRLEGFEGKSAAVETYYKTIMGIGLSGSALDLTAQHKKNLGYISSLKKIDKNGEYQVCALEKKMPGMVQGLSVVLPPPDSRPKKTPEDEFNRNYEKYVLEYRQQISLDKDDSMANGVWVTAITDQDLKDEIDQNFPDIILTKDSFLSDGKYFYDETNKIKFTQISHNSNCAQVRIEFNTPKNATSTVFALNTPIKQPLFSDVIATTSTPTKSSLQWKVPQEWPAQTIPVTTPSSGSQTTLAGAMSMAPSSVITVNQVPAVSVTVEKPTTQTTLTPAQKDVMWCHTFTNDLAKGHVGTEVAYLHTLLKKEGYVISSSEVTGKKYGDSTVIAVSKYKVRVSTSNTDGATFGPFVREKVNMKYGCSTSLITKETQIASVISAIEGIIENLKKLSQ